MRDIVGGRDAGTGGNRDGSQRRRQWEENACLSH
jgi:hypothetical protein